MIVCQIWDPPKHDTSLLEELNHETGESQTGTCSKALKAEWKLRIHHIILCLFITMSDHFLRIIW